MPEYRDVAGMRQEMENWQRTGAPARFTPAGVLFHLDACPQAPDHTGLLRALMRLVDEHEMHGPGVHPDLRRRVAAALNETEK